MNVLAIFPFISLLLLTSSLSSSSSKKLPYLEAGSSLYVEKSDVLSSPSHYFMAGFHPVGENAFSFAIWFCQSANATPTVIWMANRDQPVNGKGTKLSVLSNGKLVLSDAGLITIWETNPISNTTSKLRLLDNGNLVLQDAHNNGNTSWQSFDHPTNTLLPGQIFNKDTNLISSRSAGNYSSGFFKLYFDNDNILRLTFNGPEVSTFYWPNPDVLSWQEGRTTYNDTKIASLDSLGYFKSSDQFSFPSADAGSVSIRRLTLDEDGNLRLYSLDPGRRDWVVSWQVFSQPCKVRGVCGPNSQCMYSPSSGRSCGCLPGFKMRNPTDWIYGCEPEFQYPINSSDVDFLQLPHAESKGYDYKYIQGITLDKCKQICSVEVQCKAVNFFFDPSTKNNSCYPKNRLFNGYRTFDSLGTLYVKLPKSVLANYYSQIGDSELLNCSIVVTKPLNRTYPLKKQSGSLKNLIWVACALGGIEVMSILLVVLFLYLRKHIESSKAEDEGYVLASSGFKRFTYHELKRATRGFSEEIGRGGGGIVYKGTLSDQRAIAVKKLNPAYQGDDEFLAEVSTIGKLHHMNVIEMWGYCIEGKNRLLVYEYMECGSLTQNLFSNNNPLDWKRRFQIALGTARGLAYLHEECLEWILHCDIKGQNILLDSDYQPKVADFGLSKLLKRDVIDKSDFSKIRGTRGYMAPEWVSNMRITSKVDVYSYGIVMLEMIIGRSACGNENEVIEDASVTGHWQEMISWMRKKVEADDSNDSWIENIVAPSFCANFNLDEVSTLIKVALKCVEENKDMRPTMKQVVGMLEK